MIHANAEPKRSFGLNFSSQAAQPIRFIIECAASFGQFCVKHFRVDWCQSVKFIDMYEEKLGAEPSRQSCRDIDRFSRSAGEICSANNWALMGLLFHVVLT
jgi:hypothetical protein